MLELLPALTVLVVIIESYPVTPSKEKVIETDAAST